MDSHTKGYIEKVINPWDQGADAWNEFVESGADYYRTEVHGPALVKACGKVDGLRVLDLGCGQGYMSRQLALKGARVVGVDLSEGQIGHARAHEAEHPLGIEYRVMDAGKVGKNWDANSFGLVMACMSLQDMPDPEHALRGAFQVLVQGGRLVFSVPNPLTDTPYREWERNDTGMKLSLKIDRYFESGPSIIHWNMPRLNYHWDTPQWRWTLSEWSQMLDDAGFLVRRIYEPRPTAQQVEQNPELDDCFRIPYFLVFSCLRREYL